MKVVTKPHTFQAKSWEQFPKSVTLEVAPGAEIVDMRCTGIDVTLFVEEEEYAEKETREVLLYRLGHPYGRPDPARYQRLGVVGEADVKCVAYISLSSPLSLRPEGEESATA